MPILIDCPTCHKQLRVQDALIGKRIKCPSCMTIITAAAPGERSAAPPPVPPGRPPAQPPREPVDEEVDYESEDDGYEGENRDERRRSKKKKKARRAAERVKLPAIFMLILGIFGALLLIIGTLIASLGAGVAAVAAADAQKAQQAQPQRFGGQQRLGGEPPGGLDPTKIMAIGIGFMIAIAVVGLIFHALMVLGSVFMLKLRSYGMSVTASIASMLAGGFGCFGGAAVGGALFPFCGCVAVIFIPVYLGIGIWSLVVLLSADVKTAFA